MLENKNGMFEQIGSMKIDHALNDDAIVQIVTLFQNIMDGKKAQERPEPTYKNPVSKNKRPRPKKAPAKKMTKPAYMLPIPGDEACFKALAGFEEWRTIAQAHDLIDKYSPKNSFDTNVKRAWYQEYLDRRQETYEEQTARRGKGRMSYMYKLTDSGKEFLDILRKQANGMELT
jgi:hypothetical protein